MAHHEEVTDLMAEVARLQAIEKAVKWVLEDGVFKAPEEWNWLCQRWYGVLKDASKARRAD